MNEFHAGFCCGHYATQTTTHNILREIYYFPTIFADTLNVVKIFQPFQLVTLKQHLVAMPLRNVAIDAPFQQWHLEFIGELKYNSKNVYRWIPTETNYFTKWVEGIPTKKETNYVVMDFLEDKLLPGSVFLPILSSTMLKLLTPLLWHPCVTIMV